MHPAKTLKIAEKKRQLEEKRHQKRLEAIIGKEYTGTAKEEKK